MQKNTRQGPLHLEQMQQSKLLPAWFTCIRWWWERKIIKICQNYHLNITTQKQVKVLKDTKVPPIAFHAWLCGRCGDDVPHEKGLVDSTSPLHVRGVRGAVASGGKSHYNVLVGMVQFCCCLNSELCLQATRESITPACLGSSLKVALVLISIKTSISWHNSLGLQRWICLALPFCFVKFPHIWWL